MLFYLHKKKRGLQMFDDFNEQITYDTIAEMGYIFLSEPFKFEVTYTEELPENPDLNLDLGNGVPIVGIELGGKSAKKIYTLKDEDKKFITKTTDDGKMFFSFMLENKPIRKSVLYEGIEDIKFLFADVTCLEFIGVEVYGNNIHYQEYLSSK
jgi:uncharacterized protein YuzE